MKVNFGQMLLINEYMAEEVELNDNQMEELAGIGFLQKVQTDEYFGYSMTEEGMAFVLEAKLG